MVRGFRRIAVIQSLLDDLGPAASRPANNSLRRTIDGQPGTAAIAERIEAIAAAQGDRRRAARLPMNLAGVVSRLLGAVI